jgi:hypothetical protein
MSRRRSRRFAAGSPRPLRRPWRRGAARGPLDRPVAQKGWEARVNAPLPSPISRQRGSSRCGDRRRRSSSPRWGDADRDPSPASPPPLVPRRTAPLRMARRGLLLRPPTARGSPTTARRCTRGSAYRTREPNYR